MNPAGTVRVANAYPLTVRDLFEPVHNVHQVVLVRHDGVDVLVGARDLVDQALVLAVLYALGLLLQVFAGEAPCGLAATHTPAGAVGARA